MSMNKIVFSALIVGLIIGAAMVMWDEVPEMPFWEDIVIRASGLILCGLCSVSISLELDRRDEKGQSRNK